MNMSRLSFFNFIFKIRPITFHGIFIYVIVCILYIYIYILRKRKRNRVINRLIGWIFFDQFHKDIVNKEKVSLYFERIVKFWQESLTANRNENFINLK